MKVVDVAVSNTLYEFDKLYSYVVPENFEVFVGQRVMVPFGKGSPRLGMIISVCVDDAKDTENLKAILSTEDVAPVLSDELIKIAIWLKENTFCTYFDAIKAMLPPGMSKICDTVYSINKNFDIESLNPQEQSVYNILKKKRSIIRKKDLEKISSNISPILDMLLKKGAISSTQASLQKVSEKTASLIKLSAGYISVPLTPRQTEIVEILEQMGEISVKELIYYTGASKTIVEKLIKLGVCDVYKDREYRKPPSPKYFSEQREIISLSKEQLEVEERLYSLYKSGVGATAILYGVTGSGKTQVFLKLCQRCIEDGRQAIILVPEIALTPQTIATFNAIFGERVAVLHSMLSMGQRLDEWHRISNDCVDVVVGTRSAIFAPLKKLGLVVIDEEHENTYKSEHTPRYDARDVARQRIGLNEGLCVLASATPSVESFYRAHSGKFSIFTLRQRYGDAKLPYVGIINLQHEDMLGKNISDTLAVEIQRNLDREEQSILLVNRRGHSTLVRCGNCHEYVMCKNCSVSMKYHRVNNSLVCHYCGAIQKYTGVCPSCTSESLVLTGAGTQRLEHELELRFPSARILRMDTDTTVRRSVYEQSLVDFRDGKYDILVGTQMVAKGLNLPMVTLVGVVGVDNLLYSGGFKNYEKVFSLITQVVGRAGRYSKQGRAFIETYSPEHPVILSAAAQDYDEFYMDEIRIRRLSLYPPFCMLVSFIISAEDENIVKLAATAVAELAATVAKKEFSTMPIRLFGATQAQIYKLSGKYRYNVIMKLKRHRQTMDYISSVLTKAKIANRQVTIVVETIFEG